MLKIWDANKNSPITREWCMWDWVLLWQNYLEQLSKTFGYLHNGNRRAGSVSRDVWGGSATLKILAHQRQVTPWLHDIDKVVEGWWWYVTLKPKLKTAEQYTRASGENKNVSQQKNLKTEGLHTPFCSPNTTNPVHVVLLFVRQRHVDNWGQKQERVSVWIRASPEWQCLQSFNAWHFPHISQGLGREGEHSFWKFLSITLGSLDWLQAAGGGGESQELFQLPRLPK